MKLTIIALSFVFLFGIETNAQKRLIGTTTENGGSVFSINSDGSSPTQLLDLSYPQSPTYIQLYLHEGKFYGMTSGGGSYGLGTIFSIDEDGTNFQKLHDFDGTNGSSPNGSLTIYGTQQLVGLTSDGGTNGDGTIFTIDTDGSDFTVIHHFNGTDGSDPQGPVYRLGANLYGMTRAGGANGHGTIFVFGGTTLGTLHSFNITDGRDPYGSLILTENKLRGMTRIGGSSNFGVIFSVSINGTNFTVDHDFDNTNGRNPYGDLILLNNKLWGMTKSGGTSDQGIIFSIDDDGTGFQKEHDFALATGSLPHGNLIENNGKFWGMTSAGGANSFGVIFSIDPDGTNYTNEYDFDGILGQNPLGSLTANGTELWGAVNAGIFKIDNDGTNFSQVHEFDYERGGKIYGPMIEIDKQLWGMTQTDGIDGHGLIFKMDLDGSNHSIVHQFSGNDGSQPYGGLLNSNNKVWGVTSTGGTNNAGTLFSVNEDGSGFNVDHHFEAVVTNGENPRGSLIEANGKLYGVTHGAGANDHGTIYSIESDGTSFDLLYSFDLTNGRWPNELLDFGGKLWGTTYQGGTSGAGVIFHIDYNGTNFQKVHDFNGTTNGGFPDCKLLEVNNQLYGTGATGGANSAGTVFRIDSDGNNFTILHNFEITDGAVPSSSLTYSSGKLWGTTQSGGSESGGIVFSINTDGTGFTNELDLSGAYGVTPVYTKLLEIKNEPTISFSETNKAYGDPDFTLSATSSSSGQILYSSSDASVVSVNGSNAQVTGAGDGITITAYQEEDADNYYAEATQVINVAKANLEITPTTETISYGEDPTFPLSYSGFVYDDTSADITPPVANASYTGTGNYTITLSGGSSDDYVLQLNNGLLIVEKALLEVTADDKTMTFGGSVPSLTLTYDGFAFNENISFLNEQPTAQTSATNTSDAGIYDIEVTGGISANYQFQLNNGTLTIEKADQTINFTSPPGNLTSDSPDVTLEATASSGLDVTFEIDDTTVGTISGNILTLIGGGSAVITANQVGNINYNAALPVTRNLTVTAVLSTIDSDDMLLYPNPSTDQFNISDEISVGQLKIISLEGKIVKSFNTPQNNTFSINDIPDGMYLVLIQSDNGDWNTTKLKKGN